MSTATVVRCFGIRHHGPGSSRSLLRALDTFAPALVLLEAPIDAASMLGVVGDEDLRPPVALLAYAVDDPLRASFSPFAAYSPEWIALQWGRRHGVEVRPMDLALTHVLAASDDDEGKRGHDPIGALAAAGGDADDPERWWEDMVEHRHDGDPFDAITEAMAAVREGVSPPTGIEAAREATMRTTLRAALRQGHERIAVVCGAWHVPALALQPGMPSFGSMVPVPSAKEDAATLRGIARTKVAVTWVPWTHRRLASGTGYGAGVQSPGWYAHVFEYPGAAAAANWFTAAAHLLRARDHAVSPDHVVSATRLANALAALRGRPIPGLTEVDDAAMAVLAEGRLGVLSLIRNEMVVGSQIGSVPASTPMVPLARDLTAIARRLRMKPEATARLLELDLRKPRDLERSQLLHRLVALSVEWGSAAEGRRSIGTFRETWRLCWEPEFELQLIDASGYGTTIERAAAARLLEQAEHAPSLAGVSSCAEHALLAGLDDTVDRVMELVAISAARDVDVVHLMEALGPLARVLRYGDVRSTAAPAVAPVVDGLVARITAGIGPACVSLDDATAAAMVQNLVGTNAALSLLEHPARIALWPEALVRVAETHTCHGILRGAIARLLLDAGYWSADAVSRRLSSALTPGTPPAAGAAFVEGFLSGSGTVLLHDAALLSLVDTWMASLNPDAFMDVLPLLRRTFGTFEVGERRRIGELVAGRTDGRPPAAFGWDLDAARAATAVRTVRVLLGVDAASGGAR